MRWEMSGPNGQETKVVQNGHGKVIHSATELPLPSWHTKYTRQEYFPALLCALESERPATDVIYVGLEKLGENSVHHIHVSTGASGKSKFADAAERIISDFHLYVDAQTFMVVKTARYVFSPQAIENHSLYETYYTDYKKVDGIWMPFTITHFLSGQKMDDITFDRIQLNTAIDDTEFGK